jgi:AbrB family looped-hinge helix DNA binding protein
MDQPVESEIRERGELTIPKKIREAFHLESGQKIEFIPIGNDALLLTPKRLELQEARRQIQRILKQAKADPRDVLQGLEASREETFQKHFGKKHGPKE